jgi:ABC-type multidrug transport system ATPase subunit
MLLSSHLLVDVERVCGFVVIIRQGSIVAQGEMQRLLGGVSDVLAATLSESAARLSLRFYLEKVAFYLEGEAVLILSAVTIICLALAVLQLRRVEFA